MAEIRVGHTGPAAKQALCCDWSVRVAGSWRRHAGPGRDGARTFYNAALMTPLVLRFHRQIPCCQ